MNATSALTSALDLNALRSRRPATASGDRVANGTARRIRRNGSSSANASKNLGRFPAVRVFAADTQQTPPNQGTWGDWNDLVKPGQSATGRVVVTPSPTDPGNPLDWWKDAIVYQIFPDRFAPDPAGPPTGASLDPWGSIPTIRSFQGGSIKGITANLDYIQSLGINTIYTTPVFLSTANHRYHPSDFMKVDPMLGGEDAFRELIDEIHKRGMRFVLDGVFNHTGRGHWAFTSLLDGQEQSPYKGWFLPKSFPVRAYDVERYHVNYECWWDLPDLPKLNFNNEGVVEHILDVGEWWVKEFNIDGWRLDYPIEIPNEFWKEYRRRVRAVNPGAVTVGELFGVRPDCVGEGNHFDSLMNYAFGTCSLGFVGCGFELRQDDAIGGEYQVIAVDAKGFKDNFGEVCAAYQKAHTESKGGLGGGSAHPSMLMNLFDSHDTARALWMLQGDTAALKMLLLMMACAPGPSMLYQGTEVGQTSANGLKGAGRDPANREAFPWHKKEDWDVDLLEHVKGVNHLRRDLYALRRGGLRWCEATRPSRAPDGSEAPVELNPEEGREECENLLVWERFFDSRDDGVDAVCLFHSGRVEGTGVMTVRTGFNPGETLVAAYTSLGVEGNYAVDAEGCVKISMPPQTAAVLTLPRDMHKK